MNLLGIPATLVGSEEWQEIEKREASLGEEVLFEQIISQRLWSNAEIAWVIKRLLYYYGKKDELLKKTPKDRLFLTMTNILRCLFIVLDSANPDFDDNLRSYLCSKLSDSTWGITNRTRDYLYKIKD